MCGAQNASESFCIAEVWQGIAVEGEDASAAISLVSRHKEGPLGETNGPSLGRKRPRWATTHRINRTCRSTADGLVRGAVQLRRSGSEYISARMWPMRNDPGFLPSATAIPGGKSTCGQSRCNYIRRMDRPHRMPAGRSAVITDRTAATRAHLEFAHTLADLSGSTILPYFRKPLAVGNKAGPAAFDPVTAADRAAERVIRKAPRPLSRSRHRRRGVRRRRRQGPLPLGDRSDRRHAGLHHGLPAVGDADRPHGRTEACAGPDEPALHRRAVLVGRGGGALARTGRQGATHQDAALRAAWAKPC